MGRNLKESGPLKVIGLMSGTSMDGIDAAWLETDGEAVAAFGPAVAKAYSPDFRTRLHRFIAAAPERHHPAAARLEAELTDLHAAAVHELVEKAGALPDLIGFHGQTIWHRPQRRATWQMGDGARLAKAMNVPVVFDFRANDVARGGQGAPLAPVFHAALARALPKPVAVINIGGVGNITWIGEGDDLLAFDTGPGNGLLDDWMLKHMNVPIDRDGRMALSGRVDAERLARMLSNKYLAQRPPKSLDRFDFTADSIKGLSVADGAATLVDLTVACIAQALAHCPAKPKRLLVTGGGRHNPAMMARLAALTELPVDPVEREGWQGDMLEAQAFAYMAARSVRNLPLSFPTTTGVPAPMVGGKLVQSN
ncbi:MAG: anhydro-N-acetylmuramic acid kinase [Rhodospirillaceae bacterium]|nr:anhydro-N-acetylmuramic acid kinase [Rhodospirillaceae bacterium]